MKICHHEIAFIFFLQFYVIANGAEITPQVQETRWPNAAHYNFFTLGNFINHPLNIAVKIIKSPARSPAFLSRFSACIKDNNTGVKPLNLQYGSE